MGSIDPTPDSSLDLTTRYFDLNTNGVDIDLRADIVLTAWLLALVRTRDERTATFEWRIGKGDDDDGQDKHDKAGRRRFSSREALGAAALDLNGDVSSITVGAVEEAVDAYIGSGAPAKQKRRWSRLSPEALVVSTGTLSQADKDDLDEGGQEGVIHLETSTSAGRLAIRPLFCSATILPYTLTRYITTLASLLQTRLRLPHPSSSSPHSTPTTIAASLAPTAFDLDSIWRWCADLPPTLDFCMQDLVAQQASHHGEKVAIEAWDGCLTYAQVEGYSSVLARALRGVGGGVEKDDFVPLCFEKSRWTVVAVLAVMKAGATIVMMDPSLPLARLQNMAVQVGARTMVSSREQEGLAREILPEGGRFILEAGQEGVTTMAGMQLSWSDGDKTTHQVLDLARLAPVALPPVPASTLMYIIFTSGSTGTPKGVKISHSTYTSSALPRAAAVGYTSTSRVLDFASYAFDVSIDSMLLTLANGGTLCIPSDEDRLNDINGVMRAMRINYAGITPSVARILDPDVIRGLSALGLGGEASAPRDVNLWGEMARIVIGYGPCECTIGCTVNSSAATGRDYISIGPGNGAAIWVVHPDDHNMLLPVGAVGELLVEGPIVGQGYLHDEVKTAAAFIEDPPWLVAGHASHPGRRGQRLYKTGDLGMYDPDGSGEIVFAGRKDTQVKLRGQRVELGEIESQLKARLPAGTHVIAEVITPRGSTTATLVAFVATAARVNGVEELAHAELPLPVDLSSALGTVTADIATVLPRYMVPNAYIPVNYIPTLISGKIDRKRLRQFGASVDLQEDAMDEDTTEPVGNRELTDVEQRLRTAWSQVLKLEEASIGLNDNFFALGGESLAAMKLVRICRDLGLALSVMNTFSHPKLVSMAETLRDLGTNNTTGEAAADGSNSPPPPFSLLTSQTPERAREEAAQACGIDPSSIEDIYPCTPTQEALVTFSMKATEVYVAQRIARVPTHVSLPALKRAWEAVVAARPILRTRVAQLSMEPGLQQVVVKEPLAWRHATGGLQAYLAQDRTQVMDLGQSMARYAIVVEEEETQATTHMVWTVHHVQYDGWSEPLILDEVVRALALASTSPSQPIALPPHPTQMSSFVRWLRASELTNPGKAAMDAFWRTDLRGAGRGPQFPPTPSRDYLPTPDAFLSRQLHLDNLPAAPFTTATLLRGAWALVAAKHTGAEDVVFGETLTGRDIALAGVEDVWGPLNATIPVRVRLSHRDAMTVKVGEYLDRIQKSAASRAPFQHMGMQYIRRVSADAQRACEAPTGIVVQPEPELVGGALGFALGDPVREALHFNPYPLMLAVGLQRGGGVRVCASFDSGLVSVRLMECVLAQLEAACLEMMAGQERMVGEVSCLPRAEVEQIRLWNACLPPALEDGPVLDDSNLVRGAVYPLPQGSVAWVVDPRNASILSPVGCPGELWLEFGAYSSSDTVPPAWLVDSRGEAVAKKAFLQATGDIVQLRPDGSIVFFGRKEDMMMAAYGAGQIADLEAHCAELLPSSVRAAAAVVATLSTSGSLQNGQEEQQSEQSLIIFLTQEQQEQQSNGNASLELLFTAFDINCDVFSTKINNTISSTLAMSLKRLDRSIREDLSASFTPSAYVLVKSLPVDENGAIDHKVLAQVAANIPPDVLQHLYRKLTSAWDTLGNSDSTGTLTPAEDILRSSWARLLAMPAEEIDLDGNFFRLGGDSVLAMKLVSGLRAQGHGLTVANVFRHMRLRALAKVLKIGSATNSKGAAKPPAPYRPFSTLELRSAELGLTMGVEDCLSNVVRPKLANPAWQIQDVAPVTDSQAMDIAGTIQTPRTSVQYTMLYLPTSISAPRLLAACANLIKTHDILRTVFIQHASTTFLQVVLAQLEQPSVITQHTGAEPLEHLVTALNKRDAEDASSFQLGAPFVRFFHVVSTSQAADKQCLVLRLSHAQYDGISLPRLLSDLAALYTDTALPSFLPFPTYTAYINNPATQAKALAYWRPLFQGSTLATIPEAPAQAGEKGLFKETVAVPAFTPLEGGITTATLLTAAWALVLARRLHTADVTFGGVTSGRAMDDFPGVEDVVGPCYQFTPIRVAFTAGCMISQLLQSVQTQSAESAAHDSVGFSRLAAAGCWKGQQSASFGSLVHHQDWDDSDTMPFGPGGVVAELGIWNPHGDAASPVKAVSFVKEGALRVGVVGSERNPGLVEELLGELGAAVRELVVGGEAVLVL